MTALRQRARPILGCFSLFVSAAVVTAVVLVFLSAFDQPSLPERSITAERIEQAISRVLITILIILSAGVAGVTLAVFSILRKERPLWIPILALSVGAVPVGVTFIIVAIIILNT
jgi:hypothetical protein